MKIFIAIAFLMVTSCSSNKQIDGYQLTKESYEIAKEKEGELDILFNVSLTARGIDPRDSSYRITRIGITLKDGETITIPGIKRYMSDKEINKLPFYENIKKYAELNNLSDSIAYKFVKEHSVKIIELVNELKAFEIQSTPRLGEFIIFTITSTDQMVYVPDTSKVNHQYWKSYFRTSNKFDDKWYYRKIEKEIK